MAMSHYQRLYFVAVIILVLQLLFVYASSPTSKGEVVYEEMTILGSRPPTCQNKCNSCHPCMAVQVAAQTVLTPVQTEPGSAAATTNSDYKPLDWKCMCKHHVFNP